MLKDLLNKTRSEDKEIDEKFNKQYQLIENQENYIKDQVKDYMAQANQLEDLRKRASRLDDA